MVSWENQSKDKHVTYKCAMRRPAIYDIETRCVKLGKMMVSEIVVRGTKK